MTYDNVEVGHAYLCFERSVRAHVHREQLAHLVHELVVDPAAAEAKLAELGDDQSTSGPLVAADSICPAGQLLPKGARIFGWIDPGGIRYLEGFENRVEQLRSLLRA